MLVLVPPPPPPTAVVNSYISKYQEHFPIDYNISKEMQKFLDYNNINNQMNLRDSNGFKIIVEEVNHQPFNFTSKIVYNSSKTENTDTMILD